MATWVDGNSNFASNHDSPSKIVDTLLWYFTLHTEKFFYPGAANFLRRVTTRDAPPLLSASRSAPSSISNFLLSTLSFQLFSVILA
ncbi:hypothetical protein DQQ10_25400 [Pseudochryseolinea flava]|uniref:Uncharacterized protein n=1 Tax=Pseudochryseolinea flava TaxID=2059302 RepID=A0A364XX22_9BACT|nr:hypothetical protein DQQ10_25400 [Pseudochryseolinea flava]